MKRRIKAYQQLEHSDCGIVCVRILARYWGKRISLRAVRELCDMDRQGISIREISATLKKLGMDSASIRVPLEELRKMPLPAVLFWKQSHFVVLYKVSRDGKRFYVADPAQGKMIFSAEEMKEHWLSGAECGAALLCEPAEDFKADRVLEEKPRIFKLLGLMKRLLLSQRHSFMLIIGFSLLCMIADIALPLLFQHTVDEGIARRDISLIWILVLSQFLIFLGNYVAQNVVDYVLTRLGLKVSLDMMNEYLGKLIVRPLDFFARKVNSDLIQKAEDQQRIKDFIVTMPNVLFFLCLNLIVFSAMLMYYSRFIFIFFLCCTAASMFWTMAFLRKRRSIDYTSNTYVAENRNNIYELIHGIAEIKVNGAQEIRLSVWQRLQEKINHLARKNYYVRVLMSGGNTMLSRIRDIAVTGICASMVVSGEMSLGIMMTVSYIIGRLSVPFNSMLDTVYTVQNASISMERVEEILDWKEDAPQQDEVMTAGTLELKGVSFKYPGAHSPEVLSAIDLTIRKGETVALVGPSGCGKSTLIKVILNLFSPVSGEVRNDGKKLTVDNQTAWLRNCGIVMQEGTVFSGTILSNIAIADAEPDLKKARQAAELASLADFIDSLPMGFHSRLGVAGVELSGGQKQRLFIARALYKNPNLLILDEATSSLDAINEARIVRNIRNNSATRTVVIAAHRLSTVRYADKIVYMDKGRILETGTHEHLMASQGHYFNLVSRQLTEETDESA